MIKRGSFRSNGTFQVEIGWWGGCNSKTVHTQSPNEMYLIILDLLNKDKLSKLDICTKWLLTKVHKIIV